MEKHHYHSRYRTHRHSKCAVLQIENTRLIKEKRKRRTTKIIRTTRMAKYELTIFIPQ